MTFKLSDFHYGTRLRQLVDKSAHTSTEVAKRMGYHDRASIYDLYQKEWIKRDVLKKALKALNISESDFFGENETTDLVNDQFQPYTVKKKFLEERVDDLEQQISALQNEIDNLSKKLKVTS